MVTWETFPLPTDISDITKHGSVPSERNPATTAVTSTHQASEKIPH